MACSSMESTDCAEFICTTPQIFRFIKHEIKPGNGGKLKKKEQHACFVLFAICTEGLVQPLRSLQFATCSNQM